MDTLRRETRVRGVFVVLAAVALIGCGTGAGGPVQSLLDPLSVASVTPTEILAGTTVVVRGAGFIADDLGAQEVRLRGLPGGEAVLPATFVAADTLSVVVTRDLLQKLGVDGPPVTVEVEIVRTSYQGDGATDAASFTAALRAVSQLAPQVSAVTPSDVYPGAELRIRGSGFLQHTEGTSLVVFDGQFTMHDPPLQKPLPGLPVPATWISRQELAVTLTPDLFGIHPGMFEGGVRVRNEVEGAAHAESESFSGMRLAYAGASVSAVEPLTVRRGQRVTVRGLGFVPTDTALEATTLILLEGTFTGLDGSTLDLTGDSAMALFPDAFSNGSAMEYVLRVELDPYGQPTGLGMLPGRFDGTVSPLLLNGADSSKGAGLPLTLEVARQLQIVRLKYLASFDETMKRFGLYEVRDLVRARILEVCARDYEGISIRFQEDVPSDFVEFSVVEVLGVDPNGAGLFGLDNTEGKDVGNLRFNDVIGGVNAATEEAGYYPYGGVFVDSFLQFSPTISAGQMELASPRFDDLFGPFAPELGGEPVAPGEYPGGARDGTIAEAVRTLGNIVGSTITHEVGHSLGLADVEGNFHNVGDEPNRLMDAGAFRPFEERAEIDGLGPAVFAPGDRAYLERILPAQ